MNMNSIFSKIRKYNKENYRQLLFCITFGVLLITSFASTMFSPTIQNVFEDGGDSRKLVAMIFSIAIAGCLLFSVYAMGLFLKYKSKETGVFLALGASKKVLTRGLYAELINILLPCAAIGVVGGMIISFGIWQGFNHFFVGSEQANYQFSPFGALAGLLFFLVVLLISLGMAMRFMRRSNIMAILNDERTGEAVKGITKGYGISGMVFVSLGLILGYGVPAISGNVFHFLMPSIWNVTYLLVLLGMYRLTAYAISYNQRGNNPQKYYKKLISANMMKFQGKQTVRNMLVIALLIAASLFALSYMPMIGLSNLWMNAANPTDFALHYKLSMEEVNKNDIETLAAAYQVDITEYNELIFTELVASGVDRDFNDNGILIETYQEKYLFSEFINETAYNEAMKTSLSVPKGQYILLIQPEATERIWNKYNDLDLVTNLETGKTMSLSLADSMESHSIARYESQRYILNDEDYEVMTRGVSPEHQTRQILFNVADLEGSYPFANALYDLYLEKAPAELGRMLHYDAYQHSLAVAENRDYSYAKPIELVKDNPELFGNWKYYPTIKIIFEKSFFMELAVKFLLFIYVAVICLAAVGIISYSRSISVGLSNRQLFEDLQKLGANRKYISQLITSQLSKIFLIPTVIGSVVILSFSLLMLLGNDGQLAPSELKIFGVNLLITVVVWMFLAIIYRLSLKKVKTIVA